MAYDAEAVDPLDLLQEPDEDLLLVALPFLKDGDVSVLLLVGDGDYPVVVGGFGAWTIGLDVKEEASHDTDCPTGLDMLRGWLGVRLYLGTVPRLWRLSV